ncbi:MAG: sigma-70 family RNA polymerase sigma factor [Chitinivibrionales bacterium]|nr:sigma-70 family RNA polymerase sigma factor [Chitinivibrionales bacterium]
MAVQKTDLDADKTATATQPDKAQKKEIEQLYEKYSPWVLQRCMRYTRHKQEAEDLMHSIFLKILQKFHTFRNEAAPFTWIYRITVNLCLNHVRRQWRETTLDEPILDHASFNTKGYKTIESRIIWKEILQGFSTQTKRIVFLSVYEGLSQNEIAETIGVSRKTVQKKWSQFLEKMKVKLERDGVSHATL